MCGILLNIGDEKISPEHPGLEIIKHRGPDDFDAQSFPLDNFIVGMGHRRLSIIDLSERGRQPMSFANGDFWIIYNGEIYNYVEIRKELVKEGCSFRSDSDTEVLIAAYSKWGRECLRKLNGMFAFTIYDRRKNSIFIARDRFGIKPLYYYNSAAFFRACSEIKQIAVDMRFKPEINRLKLYHFLNSGDFGFDSDTMWKGISELQPGHFIELDLKNWKPGDEIRPECWYSLPCNDILEDISFEDAVSEFRRLLTSSVKLRLRADVPIGFLLSGGLDSSTLVGLAHEIMGDHSDLKTYSSCYDDKSIDERQFIYSVIDFTGAESSLHFPKPEDVAGNVDKVIWHNDLPVLHGAPCPHWLLYRHIKLENDSRKVIIEGQGSDEILCGYGDFYWARLFELFSPHTPFSFIRQFASFQMRHHEPLKIVLRKYRRLRHPESVKYPPNPALNTAFLLGSGEPVPPIAIRREEPTIMRLHRDRLRILRYILHNVDRNSMAQSRETRVPFLDHRLVEFCLRLPTSYKIYKGFSKRILREAARDILPHKVFDRVDKQGYSSPVPMWAKNSLNGFLKKDLELSSSMPFVNKSILLDSFKRFSVRNTPFDPVWWRVAAVQRWMNIFKISV